MRDDSTSAEGRAPARPIDTVDALRAAIIIGVCACLYYVTTTFDEVPAFLGQNVLPEQFPRLVLIFIAALALLLPLEHRLEPKRWPKIRASRAVAVRPVTWLTMAFLVAAMLLARYLGTILLIFAVSLLLPILWGERRWLLLVPYAVTFTVAVAYLFSIGLGVYFEPGIFDVTFR
jgi:putative tricarboxylic transport membrane protein